MEKDGLLNFASCWLAAWTERDVGQLLAFYQDGCFYADPAVRKGLQGKQALADHLYRLFDLYPGWKWEVVELWPTAEGLVLKWQASFGRYPMAYRRQGSTSWCSGMDLSCGTKFGLTDTDCSLTVSWVSEGENKNKARQAIRCMKSSVCWATKKV